MARPKKSIDQLRLLQINIRVTLEEQVLLEEASKSYGLSVIEYIRIRSLKKQLPKYNLPSVNRDLIIELSRIGNNLNQLTRKANQNEMLSNELIQVLYHLKKKLEEVKKTLLI